MRRFPAGEISTCWRVASPLSALADHSRSVARLAPDDKSRQACILTTTLVDPRTTDPAIAAATRDYLAVIQDELAGALPAVSQYVGQY